MLKSTTRFCSNAKQSIYSSSIQQHDWSIVYVTVTHIQLLIFLLVCFICCFGYPKIHVKNEPRSRLIYRHDLSQRLIMNARNPLIWASICIFNINQKYISPNLIRDGKMVTVLSPSISNYFYEFIIIKNTNWRGRETEETYSLTPLRVEWISRGIKQLIKQKIEKRKFEIRLATLQQTMYLFFFHSDERAYITYKKKQYKRTIYIHMHVIKYGFGANNQRTPHIQWDRESGRKSVLQYILEAKRKKN